MIPLATPPTPGPPTAHARGTATSARCLGLALAGLQLLAARPAPGTDWSAGADLGWRAARVARDPAATAWNANHETFVAPRMRVSLDGNDTRLVVAARQEAFLRRSIDGRPRLTLPRLGAGVADLRWVRTGPLGSTRGYGRYARSTTPLDVAAPVTSVPGGYATWSTGARVALGPLEGAGRFDGWSYQDPRVADAHELAWEATARPLRTARSAGLVGGRGSGLARRAGRPRSGRTDLECQRRDVRRAPDTSEPGWERRAAGRRGEGGGVPAPVDRRRAAPDRAPAGRR